MLICCTLVSNAPLDQSVDRGANNNKVICSRLIRTNFHFLFGMLPLFNQFAYIHCIKILIWGTFVSSSPFAQLVERGVNNAKVECSRLKPSRFHFLFGSLSLFKYLRTSLLQE